MSRPSQSPCSAFGAVGSDALVDITRLSRDNEILIKIRTETGTLEIEMTPEQFALALTGRCEVAAKIYRTSKRVFKPNETSAGTAPEGEDGQHSRP